MLLLVLSRDSYRALRTEFLFQRISLSAQKKVFPNLKLSQANKFCHLFLLEITTTTAVDTGLGTHLQEKKGEKYEDGG